MHHYLLTHKKTGIIMAIKLKDPLHYFNNDIFRKFNISKNIGYRIIRNADTHGGERTFHSTYPETKGRPKKLTEEYIAILVTFIEKNGFDSKTIPYEGLLNAASIKVLYTVLKKTIQKALKSVDFQKYITCEKIPWERDCLNCIIEKENIKEKNKKRIHYWATISYNFKNQLVWYDNKILKPVDFVLEENNNSNYGSKGNRRGKKNIVKQWKEENGLKYYFNCSGYPDFIPINKVWQSPKQYLRKRGKWDDEICWELVEEGWTALTQERINLWINIIPQIL
ncbi:hypothetical protein QR685DRAFT_588997 [Neurospora intermedia]|uniref:Uncharacterized protein n=1 Tax=Neurospora intermedia TaxID=5142 RepID=A0ABR3D9Z9_NEUIN